MKERFLFEDELENHLKEKADQFKMYPSDNVWNEVYRSVHTRRRRFIAGMSVLIGGILILAGTQLIAPSRNTPLIPASAKSKSTPSDISESSLTPASTTPADIKTIPPPFAMQSGAADFSITDHISAGSTLPKLPGRAESEPVAKNILPGNLKVAMRPAASAIVVDLSEPAPSKHVNPGIVSEGMPEKPVTQQIAHAHSDRFSWQIYVVPTLNTRILTGMNYQTISQAVQGSPIMVVHFANVNGFVDNTPAMGYDVGGNILYKLTKNISLKAGIDFSYNRYYIRAYATGQASAARLNSYLGYVADSLQNNASGGTVLEKNTQRYQNKYYQLSVPIGVEMKVAGKGKVQLHLGATIQPSYLLNSDSYVLSENYDSYTKDPSAFRKWNLNMGAEAFISYGVGKIRWELGPQVRYQIFSTYKDSYPMKENMLNYGLRIGITKTIR